MKNFLEELEKYRNKQHKPKQSEADIKRKELKAKYKALVGSRALYYSKSERDRRVVRIIGVTDHYVMLTYNYYGPTYEGTVRTCSCLFALLCGEDRLEVE